MTARSYKPVWVALAALAAGQTIYGAAFIWRSSFVVEGQRYFCLFDDAMISLRYADNWARGQGWVFNAEERVEGYTNFGWTLILGLFHLLHLSQLQTCLLVQVLGIPVLWGCLGVTAALGRACRLSPAGAIGTLVLTAFYYNLHYFSLLGMETGLLTVLVTLSLRDAAIAARARRGAAQVLLWLVPAVLLRSDALVLVFFVCGFLFLVVRSGRLRVLAGFVCVLAVIAAHSLWRYHYYGDWMPNTYYLKLTGWPLPRRLIAGLRHSFWTAAQFGVPVCLAVCTALRLRRWHLLMFGTFCTALAYQVYCGGDAWPLNRFIVPVAPAIFACAALGLHRLSALLARGRGRLWAVALGTLICLVAVNGVHWDHWLLLVPPHWTIDNRANIRLHVALQRIAEPQASIAVCYAGVTPYYSRRKAIDLLGKCDWHIARLPVGASNLPGHNKFNIAWSLRTRRPDLVLHSAFLTARPPFSDYRPVAVCVDGTDVLLYRRSDSEHVHGGRPLSTAEAYHLYDAWLDH